MCSGWNITGMSLCTFSKAVGLTTLAWPGMPLLTRPWSNYVWNVKLPESELEDFSLLAASTIFEKVRLVQITGKMISYSHFAEDTLCSRETKQKLVVSFFFNTKLFELIILSSTRGTQIWHGVSRLLHRKHLQPNQKKKCHLLIKTH